MSGPPVDRRSRRLVGVATPTKRRKRGCLGAAEAGGTRPARKAVEPCSVRRTVAATGQPGREIHERRQRDARSARSRPLPPSRRDLACPHVRKPRSTWASSPTSTPVRPLSPSGSCTSPESSTTRGRSTPAPPVPTPRARAPPRHHDQGRGRLVPARRHRPSTSSTPRATPTSSPRSSASLGVLDGAVLVLSAVEGVQPQTRILMRALQRLRVPTLLFVNKVDRAGADLDGVLDAIRRRLTPTSLPMGYVVGSGTPGGDVHARTAPTTALPRAGDRGARRARRRPARVVRRGAALWPRPAASGGGRPDRGPPCCTRSSPGRRPPAPASPS